MSTTPATSDKLETVEFFDLCQNYRIAPITDQSRVIEHYEDIKAFIRSNFSPRQETPATSPAREEYFEQLRVDFDEYMMSNMKPLTPDNTFEWFKIKLNDIKEVGSIQTIEKLLDKLDEATDLLKQAKGANFNSNLGARIEMFLSKFNN